jgi:homoserine kinase
MVKMETVVGQTGNLAGLISSFFLNDYELMSRSLDDLWIEPQRALLIPHFYELKRLALSISPLGFSISGAGPSMFGFSVSMDTANKLGHQLQEYLKNQNIPSSVFSSKINRKGCYQI